jgi:hypothetical protein
MVPEKFVEKRLETVKAAEEGSSMAVIPYQSKEGKQNIERILREMKKFISSNYRIEYNTLIYTVFVS